MDKITPKRRRLSSQPFTMNDRSHLVSSYNQAKKRLFFLDYDGTLVPHAQDPNIAFPSEHLLGLLSTLCKNKKNEVVIISGRDKNTLEKWLGHLNLTLVAEHSGWIRQTNKEWKKRIKASNQWKSHILPALNLFAAELPGCIIEEKEFSVVWHYRNTDPKKSKDVVKELTDHLLELSGPKDIKIMLGNSIIEVKHALIGKNFVTKELVETNESDFIIAIGDDTTDEDMFEVLPQHAFSIKVGIEGSYAQFNIPSHSDVLELLHLFTTND